MAAVEGKRYIDRRFYWLFVGSFLFLALHNGYLAFAWPLIYPTLLNIWFPEHLDEARTAKSFPDLELWIPGILYICLLYKESSVGIIGLTAALLGFLSIRKRNEAAQKKDIQSVASLLATQ